MLDPNDPLNFTHWINHRLVVVLRFLDVFTRRPIDTPLRVTIPELGWEAVRRATDSTYRFLVTETDIPTGSSFIVLVEDPDQRYINHVDITLVLPWTSPTAHTRADYLEEYVLWPTRKFRVPGSETALIGRLTSPSIGVNDLDVRLSAGVLHFPPSEGGQPPEIPFARSDLHGEFLFRLLDVSRETSGDPTPPSIGVEVRSVGGAVLPVTPATFEPDPGRVQSVTFEIP